MMGLLGWAIFGLIVELTLLRFFRWFLLQFPLVVHNLVVHNEELA